ncbi:hypothetical protein SAMN05421743_101444 [Thalassobacillus cyri]|uniref:Uncharacterized protein n=1 Tax=Thalassobacillus cyri TaxID=571932 RepID=A0A1H3WFH5_9BACI|nr:hypothetical protein SAMN05421743_101444 [Thalassobacillus cyri]
MLGDPFVQSVLLMAGGVSLLFIIFIMILLKRNKRK